LYTPGRSLKVRANNVQSNWTCSISLLLPHWISKRFTINHFITKLATTCRCKLSAPLYYLHQPLSRKFSYFFNVRFKLAAHINETAEFHGHDAEFCWRYYTGLYPGSPQTFINLFILQKCSHNYPLHVVSSIACSKHKESFGQLFSPAEILGIHSNIQVAHCCILRQIFLRILLLNYPQYRFLAQRQFFPPSIY